MAGLSLSLMIANWLVAAMWVVSLLAYYFGYSTDLIWFVFILGTGAALAEWHAIRNREAA